VNGGFLLDTNIPSELMRLRPEPKVKGWVAAQDISALFLSVVSIGELETGFTTMQDAARRARLEASLERHLALLFPGRVLPVTQAIAARWGRLDGMRQLSGRPLSAPDGMIAATALEHGLTLVTRNVKDFAGLGVTIFNPWDAA
jgi:predicted nucleic acid-binding protein